MCVTKNVQAKVSLRFVLMVMKTLSEHTDQSNDSKKAVRKGKVKKKWRVKISRQRAA